MEKLFQELRRTSRVHNYFFQICNRFVTVASDQNNVQSTYDKTQLVNIIEKSLNIHKRTALRLVNGNNKLTTTSPLVIHDNFQVLNGNGITSTTTLKYPFLLWSFDLREKFRLLKKLNYPLCTTVVLAGLPITTLKKIVNNAEKNEDRIFVLSELLQISPQKSCELLYRKQFLITRNLYTVRDILQNLKEFGIALDYVYKDPWILRYSPQIIKERILCLTEIRDEILTPKPWMLRSAEKVLDNYFKRRQVHKQILGSASLAEYLSERLECTEDQAKYLISKMPALRSKSLKTLSDIIDFLYSKGFKPFHIYRVPKILFHSVETTKERLELMENAGIKVDSLYMLTKSKKQFVQNFEVMARIQNQSLL